ncbi:hypothetical protein DB32_002892 [Sandaracinus amylolyticus]|uniref:Uncharacterized protein n=1 Tax=Sandaracinus amylolyticus TaxID=927083 RepID=A0A0F6W2D7_9BACT|nr:hypothetical protein DB32_002892 [Sandaracinus amylolyticus]
MERWGRDDEHTRTFDVERVRAVSAPAVSNAPPSEGRLRIVEVDEGRATRRDPRRE